MTANLHLFQLEFRRSVGLWLFPLMLFTAWFAGRQTDPAGVTLWLDASAQIGAGITLVAPLIAGVAAWMASRDRRRRIEELLATTPRPAVARDLTGWVAAAVWGLLAYVLVGLYRGVETARDATWGGPEFSLILLGLVTIVAAAAIGYAAGSFFPSRFTAALVAIVLFVAASFPLLTFFSGETKSRQGNATFIKDSISSEQYLSPFLLMTVGNDFRSVYQEFKDNIGPLQMAWIAGLGGIALAALALRRRRTAPAWGTLLVSTSLAIFGATMLLRADPDAISAAAVEPVCTVNVIEVCVHPAYEGALDETAAIVEAVMKPVAGLPGVPTRAMQEDPWIFVGPPPDGTLVFWMERGPDREESIAFWIAISLIQSPYQDQDMPSDGPSDAMQAQDAISIWLADQAGFGAGLDNFRGVDAAAVAAERFADLDPAQQRAWLEANFTALQAGQLSLEDLP
ncbi:MAG: hypothetical protein ACJ789_03685 [Thermomicrobiales bacterium]